MLLHKLTRILVELLKKGNVFLALQLAAEAALELDALSTKHPTKWRTGDSAMIIQIKINKLRAKSIRADLIFAWAN